MRELKYTIAELTNHVIPLGVQGEVDATKVIIDLADWVTEEVETFSVSVMVKNPAGTQYPAVVTLNGTKIYWVLSASDTAEYGDGYLQITMTTEDDAIIKSVIIRTVVFPSLSPASGEAPDPYETWITILTNLASQTDINAQNAESYMNSAAASANTAHNWADYAEHYANTQFATSIISVAFSISTSSWNNKTAVISATGITADWVALEWQFNDPDVLSTANIAWETGAGTITLTVDEIPTDTLSGKVILGLDLAVYAPERTGVTSVNGKNLDVTLVAGDINTTSSGTIEQALAALATAITNLTATVAANKTAIETRVGTLEGTVSSHISTYATDKAAIEGDIDALESDVDDLETAIEGITIPTKVSDLTNDSGFLTSATGVTSVNGSNGDVTITASDLGAIAETDLEMTLSGTTLTITKTY